jgi:chorismate mutase
MTEVATGEHVEAALKAGIDMLWIGARTTPNPFSVQEIADALRGVDVPVFVKNPINPDLQLWIGALERLNSAGLKRIAAIHRGFSWFERTPYRNSPMWEFPVRLKAAFPHLELLCDPSHIAGDPSRLGEIAQQALDLNFSGLMIETHCSPTQAKSDAKQQITPQGLHELLGSLIFRSPGPVARQHGELEELRDLIDQLDDEIMLKLASRMAIAERIGEFKQEHNIAILQPERFSRILGRLLAMRTDLGLGAGFIEEFMHAVHQESIRRQGQVPPIDAGPAAGTPERKARR